MTNWYANFSLNFKFVRHLKLLKTVKFRNQVSHKLKKTRKKNLVRKTSASPSPLGGEHGSIRLAAKEAEHTHLLAAGQDDVTKIFELWHFSGFNDAIEKNNKNTDSIIFSCKFRFCDQKSMKDPTHVCLISKIYLTPTLPF